MKTSMMKLTRWMLSCLIVCTAWAADGPKGTVPHATADKYDAHAEQDGMAIGATMLTAKQVRKLFKADVGRCCRVVEVALYPQKDGHAEVSLNDFTLRNTSQDDGAKPSSAKVAAWRSSQDKDRLRPTLIADMEMELTEKSLPQGTTATPVSGYLYFSLQEAKHATYQLEYMYQGHKVVLDLH